MKKEMQKKQPLQTLYLIGADTYNSSYGADINVFGIFDTEEQANKVLEKKYKEYKKEGIEISPFVKQLSLNKATEEYLGVTLNDKSQLYEATNYQACTSTLPSASKYDKV